MPFSPKQTLKFQRMRVVWLISGFPFLLFSNSKGLIPFLLMIGFSRELTRSSHAKSPPVFEIESRDPQFGQCSFAPVFGSASILMALVLSLFLEGNQSTLPFVFFWGGAGGIGDTYFETGNKAPNRVLPPQIASLWTRLAEINPGFRFKSCEDLSL